ncbi:gastrula zinc finger protein XlCGF57.1-like isoform X1 [Chrysoperla carnea]|uniref:gastrula zinc finger protein XlCGF57.1-like isoform X1 n=1 Tax=Chrysoperla carnea TaxID=189513 RepID=UPI001D061D6C|nr:gastrula zinc finger protein XlCGF57.1-like isoform X1 [Chrysoperla carnea]XP_044727322.1 gastrula zinc finger protein XlCGF57.1-like isoform X1 [Chrysoperla carnea]
MDKCVVTDFEKVCRICMKFDKTFLSIASFKIIDMIIACASVQIWENDDLPNQICQACFLQLQNTINFKELCENSDNAFRQIIKQNKVKLSNNQNDFDNVKDEEFENYADDNFIDIKEEEDVSEKITNENTLEKIKIRINHNEADSKKTETINMLKIENKIKPELNGLQIQTKSEEESDTSEDINDDENVLETFACEKCDQEFKKLWALGVHMHHKHRAKALKCNKCELKFYHPLHLKQHQETMHNAPNLTCTKCKKIFSNIYKLKRHKLTHSTKRMIPCRRCDKSFADKPTLKCHIKEVHESVRKFVTCHICGKLIQKKSLRNHLMTHNERKDITCDICSKTFINELSFKTHIKHMHENQKPARNHLCSICGWASTAPYQLRRHLLIHTNERPFKCDHCDKAYRRPDHLRKHITSEHLNQRNFQCKYCPQAFHAKRTLVHHERRHTGEKPHKCEVCGKGFAQNTALKIHTKIHTNSKENLTRS